MFSDCLEPQARTVGVRELTHRREDEVLKLVDVPLGGQRDADSVELPELPVLPLFQLSHPPLERDVLHRDAQENAQRRRRGVDWWIDRDVGHALGSLQARGGKDHGRVRHLGRVSQLLRLQAELGKELGEPEPLQIAEEVDVERLGGFHAGLPFAFWA